ncbi:MAG: hypothetical protein IPP83_19870 [Flavobacteriales bacterium]|nr:hypothetical protein [Flavobacteriales bacterium]
MGRLTLLFLVVLLALLPADVWAQGCAMCKAVAQSRDGGIFGGEQPIGRGLNNGILYLMAVPYLLLFLLLRKKIVSFVKEFASAQG